MLSTSYDIRISPLFKVAKHKEKAVFRTDMIRLFLFIDGFYICTTIKLYSCYYDAFSLRLSGLFQKVIIPVVILSV